MTVAGVAAVAVVVLVVVGGCGSDPADVAAGGVSSSTTTTTPGSLSVQEREDVVSADLKCRAGEDISVVQVDHVPPAPERKADESYRTAEAAANEYLARGDYADGRMPTLGPRNEAPSDGWVLMDLSENEAYLVKFDDGEKRAQYQFGGRSDGWLYMGGEGCARRADSAAG